MKKVLSGLLLSMLSVLCMAITSKTRYSGSRIFWDSKNPVTVFAGGGYARIIELQDGRLMACCESGGIKVCYSADNGKTWSQPTVIAPNANLTPNCVPDLIQLADGTIIVAYNPRPQAPYTADRHFGIRLRRSTDNGKTWSQEIFVYDADITFENGCWEPCLLELPSGELQLYFADESPYTTNGDQQISICRSWDGGVTWSQPGCVSYRQGARDGMPVPVLLHDGKTIAVAIEDNGQGYGDFIPTIVRSTLAANWKTPVLATGSNRTKAVNYDYCPVATGGAPYLRVLPGGETILSHQSCYGRQPDRQNMYVYVGNARAMGFKAMSSPFCVPENQAALWNSLSVLSDGTVLAVSGFGGNINMVKGRATSQLEVPFGSPSVNGRFTKGEGYGTQDGRQVMMGGETGTFSYADMAFDADSLYLYFQVYDSKKVVDGNFSDYVSFCIDNRGASYDVPMNTSFRYDLCLDGTIGKYIGNSKVWTERQSPSAARMVVKKTSLYYVMEVALPWSDLGKPAPVLGATMSFYMEVCNGNGSKQSVERIADTRRDEPWTWMPMHLPEEGYNEYLTAIEAPAALRHGSGRRGVYDMQGRTVPANAAGLYVVDGRKVVRK